MTPSDGPPEAIPHPPRPLRLPGGKPAPEDEPTKAVRWLAALGARVRRVTVHGTLEWLIELLERLIVLGLMALTVSVVVSLIIAPLFYRVVRRFLEEMEEAFGMKRKRPRETTDASEGELKEPPNVQKETP